MKGGVLPAYCDPPNPCPKGYTSEDGCIEVDEFENKAEFSRKYQVQKSIGFQNTSMPNAHILVISKLHV